MHKATRLTHAPRNLDWKLAKRIAPQYLEDTANLKIEMAPSEERNQALRLKAFSDADFVADKAVR